MTVPDQSTGTPRISVICIFYNAAEFIGEAIESVLAQDSSDFELLLVDDGSTDGSGEIARSYASDRPAAVRYLAHPNGQNRGMSASRNVGMAAARGDCIAFIDADDRWAPSKLREQLEILDRYPEIDAVCGTVNYWRSWAGGSDELVPTGHVQNRIIRPPEAILRVHPLGKAAAPCPSDLMVRRAVALSLGGFEEAFTGMYEDQAFLSKLYMKGSIYFADRIWLDYRRHERSCLAEAVRDGQYHAARQRFLLWFRDYLAGDPEKPPLSIKIALWRALLRYRYPRLTDHLRRVAKFVRPDLAR